MGIIHFVLGMGALLICLDLRAETPVEDPQGILLALDRFVSGSTFDEAFKLHDLSTIRISHRDCEFVCDEHLGCLLLCDNPKGLIAHHEVTELTGDAVVITDDEKRTRSTRLSRDDFEKRHGNMLRSTLERLDVYTGVEGKVVLKNLRRATYRLRSGESIESAEVVADYMVGKHAVALKYQIGRNIPAVGQILRFEMQELEMFRTDALDGRIN